MMNLIARHIIFKGRVQGVGFRFTTHRIANRHHVTGFVRNLPDGTVEMLAQGTPDDVNECMRDIEESFIGYIKQVEASDVPADSQYINFKITF
jgi:acylphosphatase